MKALSLSHWKSGEATLWKVLFYQIISYCLSLVLLYFPSVCTLLFRWSESNGQPGLRLNHMQFPSPQVHGVVVSWHHNSIPNKIRVNLAYVSSAMSHRLCSYDFRQVRLQSTRRDSDNPTRNEGGLSLSRFSGTEQWLLVI